MTRIADYDVEADWRIEAYPESSGHKPEPGDRVYVCRITISAEDGMMGVKLTFIGEDPEWMIKQASKNVAVVLMPGDKESQQEVAIEDLMRVALEHYWWIVFGVRYRKPLVPSITST